MNGPLWRQIAQRNDEQCGRVCLLLLYFFFSCLVSKKNDNHHDQETRLSVHFQSISSGDRAVSIIVVVIVSAIFPPPPAVWARSQVLNQLCCCLHVLVSSSRAVDDDLGARGQRVAELVEIGKGMRRLQGRDDALEPRHELEGLESLRIGHGVVLCAPGVLEVGVLGADARVVQARADGMGLDDLRER